jgi:DNA-binding Lrp family transcriptional regulator
MKIMKKGIDEFDIKIMKSLSEDCRKSTTQIAQEAGTARPTAIARIKELSENKIIEFGARISLPKVGLKLASVHFDIDEIETSKQLVEKLRICPRILQLIQLAGKSNYTALIYVEDAETLLSTIDCLESYLGIKVTSYQRVLPLIGDSFNLKISREKCAKTPCGKECGICLSYQQIECAGCPASNEYRGSIY